MASQGASLQNYNNELVKCKCPVCLPLHISSAALFVAIFCMKLGAVGHLFLMPCDIFAGIEDLKEKREEVNRQILQDEEEKQKIQNDLRILTERFAF